jgi:DNA-binding transcriptional LysR family regulator
MTRNVDTALLRAFVAVADMAGMTSAAGMLNLTQAAVSQQIKRLEESFGSTLFTRERKGLRLTPAGERLYGRAKRLLALNDEIWADMTTPLFEGTVRLGIPHDLVSAYLAQFLKGFARNYPNVEVTLHCAMSSELLERLEEGVIDLALTTELGCGPDGESLATERLVWAGAPGGEAYARRPLPVSIGCRLCAFRPPVLESLRSAEISWRPVSDITNLEAQCATAQADLAVLALLASTVPGTLEILSHASGLPPLPAFSINLYLPRGRSNAVAQELARHIRMSFVEGRRLAA